MILVVWNLCSRARLLAAVLLVCVASGLSGQSNPHDVFGAAGQQNENTAAQLSWTIGEGVIQTIVHSNFALTQGFHQPEPPQPPSNGIPTLSEWGVICLALLILCLGAAGISSRSSSEDGVRGNCY